MPRHRHSTTACPFDEQLCGHEPAVTPVVATTRNIQSDLEVVEQIVAEAANDVRVLTLARALAPFAALIDGSTGDYLAGAHMTTTLELVTCDGTGVGEITAASLFAAQDALNEAGVGPAVRPIAR